MKKSPAQIALCVGNPRPGVVVGLAFGVVQVELDTADAEREVVAVRDVRLGAGARQEPARFAADAIAATGEPAELPRIDCEVVAVGQFIAIESARHVFMPGDRRSWCAVRLRVREERAAAPYVVDMSVRVHQRIEAVFRPAADRVDNTGAALRPTRIEYDETIIGGKHDRMRKRLDHCDAGRDRR